MLSREALKANESKLEQAERILQLAELGRKLETEREKASCTQCSLEGVLNTQWTSVNRFCRSTSRQCHPR